MERKTMTEQQQAFLDNNPHITLVEILSDGDHLCVDSNAVCNRAGIVIREFPAYVLTTSGNLHTVAHHFRFHHHMHNVVCLGEYVLEKDERRAGENRV